MAFFSQARGTLLQNWSTAYSIFSFFKQQQLQLLLLEEDIQSTIKT